MLRFLASLVIACSLGSGAAFLAPSCKARLRASPLSHATATEKHDGRRAKQDAIRSILSQRKPHQRRDCVLPGTRVLLILNENLPGPQDELPPPPDEDGSGGLAGFAGTVYEATVEEILTKEKSHPLGIKVRVVGGKSGRVAHLLTAGENAASAAAALGAAECLPVTANKGLRSHLLGRSTTTGGGKFWTPYTTSSDLWVPRGPAGRAAESLHARGLLTDVDEPKARGKVNRYGESGAKKMRRAVAEERAAADERHKRGEVEAG